MKIWVKSKMVNEAMNRAMIRLQTILRATWGESDERFRNASEELSQAVWKMATQLYEPYGDKVDVVEVENDRLTGLTNATMGRVLTWIDAIFPVANQCEAIKSLARTIIWDIRDDIVKNCEVSKS